MPSDPGEVFELAKPRYEFGSAKLTPWHMAVSYQLYDATGQPAINGSFEYWWAAPDTFRSTWKRGALEHTDLYVKGEHHVAEKGGSLSLAETKLPSQLLTPLPNQEELSSQRVRFTRQEQTLRDMKLPCMMVIPKLQGDDPATVVPMGMFPTYCFSPNQPMLIAYYAYGASALVYDQIIDMQGLYLARAITVFENKKRILTAKVDSLVGTTATAAEFIAGPEMKVENDRRINVSIEVAAGLLLKKLPPDYPQDARDAHIAGIVVLDAVIGRDGRVHELGVVSGPSPSLVASAMRAVAQWEYKPYLLQGTPVEMRAKVNVTYSLDQ